MSNTAATKLYRAASRLRDLHVDMTISQLQLLCLVADNPGTTQAQVFKTLAQSDSAVSRNIALLTDIGTRYRAGLDLIKVEVNPEDRRERWLTLTLKGERLFTDIEKDMT